MAKVKVIIEFKITCSSQAIFKQGVLCNFFETVRNLKKFELIKYSTGSIIEGCENLKCFFIILLAFL